MSNTASAEQQVQQQTGQTQQQPPSTPQGTGATEFRYGDDAPAYLRGKSAKETVDFVTNLVSEAQQLIAQKQAAPQNTQQRTMTQQTQLALPDPDMALTDPKGYQEKLTQYLHAHQEQTVAAYAAPILNQLAGTAKELSRQDAANKDVWSKWGTEIESMVANVPAHLRTRELYDQAVVMVRGRHWQELAAEQNQRLAAAGTGLARAGLADGGSDMEAVGDAALWEKIEATPMGAAAIKVAGKQGVMNAIRAGAYKSLEEYAAMAQKSKSKVDSANPNIVYNRGAR